MVQVISGRFRLVQVVSACCCLRLIQVGSGWLRAQNVRPGKACITREKTRCGCGISRKRLAAWSSSIPAAKIGERTHQGPDRVGGGGVFYSAWFSRKCNLNRQPLP